MTARAVAIAAGDEADVARFLAAFPGDHHGEERWRRRLRHWWDANPAFSDAGAPESSEHLPVTPSVHSRPEASAHPRPRGWILRGDDGAIGGFLGNIPRLFRRSGSDVVAHCASTWRVLPAYRQLSLHLYAAHISAGRHTVLINATPNAGVIKVLESLKYRTVSISSSGRRFLLPLRPMRLARAYAGDRPGASVLSLAGATALAAMAMPARWRVAMPRGREVREITTPTDEVDTLWQAARDQVPNTSVRTAAQLAWLCTTNPHAPKHIVGCYAGGVLEGFAITREESFDGVRSIEVMDLWPAMMGRDTLMALLAGLRDRGEATGCDVLVLHDYSTALHDGFRAAGIAITRPDNATLYTREGDGGDPITRSNSYLSGIEGDAGL